VLIEATTRSLEELGGYFAKVGDHASVEDRLLFGGDHLLECSSSHDVPSQVPTIPFR
jgi:hypothetical protein